MISEKFKEIIISDLISSVRVENTLIQPTKEFEKYSKRIRDFSLRNHLPSNEVRDIITSYFLKHNCSQYTISEYFRWILNI
jgi:hypothetical protein